MQANQLQVFDKLKADITLKVEPYLHLNVGCDDSKNMATLAIKEVKHFSDLVEAKRKELVDPLNQEVKRINEYAKSICQPLDKSKDHLKKALLSFEAVLEKKRQEEARKLAEAKAKAEAEARAKAEEERQAREFASMFDGDVTENDKVKIEIETQAAQEREVAEINLQHKQEMKAVAANKVSGVRKIWKFEITDPELVNREYLMVDEKKVAAAMKELVKDGVTEIPGIRFYQEATLAVR